MRKDDQMLNEAYSKIYSQSLEEGILGRVGARVGAGLGAAGQYAGNVGRSLLGKASPVAAGQAYQQNKQANIVASVVKNALNDIQKLGLFPQGYTPTPQDTKDLSDFFNQFITTKAPASDLAPTDSAAGTDPAPTAPANGETVKTNAGTNVYDAKSGQWMLNGKPNPATGQIMNAWKKSKGIA